MGWLYALEERVCRKFSGLDIPVRSKGTDVQLSYICRLICLALFSSGILQIVFEMAAWALSPVLTNIDSDHARRREKILFRLVLFVRTAPHLLVLCFLLPAYIRGEDNLAAERVGVICIGFAAVVLLRSLSSLVHLLRAMRKTGRYCSVCHQVGRTAEGVPILLHPGNQPLLAVAGLFSSRILISRELLERSRFSDMAMDVALAHEGAHARHRDNLKAGLLSILPHISIGSGRLPSLERQWRLAAELAADEEGAQGKPERSVLLAEMLVALARENRRAMPHMLTTLLSRGEDLRVRVDRLLRRAEGNTLVKANLRERLPTAFAAVTHAGVLAMLAYSCGRLGHEAAEFILKLG
jgi:hypothetical protein